MAQRIVRGQLALEVGGRLQDIGGKVLKLDQYSGDALASQLTMIRSGLASELGRLDLLVKSCRSAQNSYPNYPSLRRAIMLAGEKIYDLTQQVQFIYNNISDGRYLSHGKELFEIGQDLRLIAFVPTSQAGATA